MIPLRLPIAGGALAWLAFGRLPDVQVCGFRWLTGLPCPLCGMTRALASLLHGEWREAIALHALSPLALILFGSVIGCDLLCLARPQFVVSERFTRRMPSACLAAILIYGIARWPLH